jgi:hypothetical protein
MKKQVGSGQNLGLQLSGITRRLSENELLEAVFNRSEKGIVWAFRPWPVQLPSVETN